MNEIVPRISPRLLVLITDNARAKTAEDILRKANMPVQFRFHGKGTATRELMDALGMDGAEKAIFIIIAPKSAAQKLMGHFSEGLKLSRRGHGVVFTVPMGGVGNFILKLLDAHVQKELENTTESEISKMMESSKYSLILAVTNRGYSEEVMKTAKSVGAKGGTVFNARRLGMEEAMQFWGISIQDEREVTVILSEKENKTAIMRAIGEKHGMASKTKGIVLSVPVEDVFGLA